MYSMSIPTGRKQISSSHKRKKSKKHHKKPKHHKKSKKHHKKSKSRSKKQRGGEGSWLESFFVGPQYLRKTYYTDLLEERLAYEHNDTEWIKWARKTYGYDTTSMITDEQREEKRENQFCAKEDDQKQSISSNWRQVCNVVGSDENV